MQNEIHIDGVQISPCGEYFNFYDNQKFEFVIFENNEKMETHHLFPSSLRRSFINIADVSHSPSRNNFLYKSLITNSFDLKMFFNSELNY